MLNMPAYADVLAALRTADAALRDVYVRTGDLAAAHAHDAIGEVLVQAEIAEEHRAAIDGRAWRMGEAPAAPRKCAEVDHRYQHGPWNVCRRCGGERP